MSTASSETTPPIRVPVRWSVIGPVLKWAVVAGAAGLMLYLRAEFATHEEVTDAVKPFAHTNQRVTSLEEFRARSESEQRSVAEKLQTITNGQSAQQATLLEISKSQERILNRLDRLADRSQSIVQ